MLVPLGTDRPLSRPTVVTHALVWLNVLIFAFQAVLTQDTFDPALIRGLLDRFALDPAHFHAWALITYAFLHGGLLHILGNMLFLWTFGPSVEDRFGRIGFLIFYLAGAVVSGGLHALVEHAPVIGASGAIAAVTGAYMVLFPRTNVKVFFFFIMIGIYQIPAGWFIGMQIAWNLFSQASGRSQGIATLAHLAGYGFGAALAFGLLASGLLKREMYDMFSLSKHAARRRQFKEAEFQAAKDLARGRQAREEAKLRAADPVLAGELATARAAVSERLEAGDPAAAAAAYKSLLERFAGTPGATVLSRRLQYEIANLLFRAGEYQTAATAYEAFLKAYPTDPERPIVRLMLGLISARYLNDPVRAKSEIAQALPGLADGQHKDLANELLVELG